MRDVVRSRRALLLVGPAALVLAAAAACSSSGTSSTSTGTSSSSAPSSTPSPSGGGSSSGSSSAAALAVTTNSSLGQIVTTGSGRTVYRFDVDAKNKSNCTGGCSSLWPPVTVTGSGMPHVMGVSSSLIGEITRSDGSKQLTIGGWPLYTYAGDTAAGTTAGEGSGGTWWAVTPSGGEAKTGAGSGSSSSTGGGNY